MNRERTQDCNHEPWRAVQVLTVFVTGLFLLGCSSPKPGQTKLAATPLGYSKTTHAERLRTIDHTEDIPVFIVSGRNLVENPERVDPFGAMRADQPMPYLAIAKVGVGEGQTSEEILADTLAPTGDLGRTPFELKSVELVRAPKVNQLDHGPGEPALADNVFEQEIDRVLRLGPSRRITIFVPGYNTHFISNTELAAEIAHFNARDGAVINFDWPSSGKWMGYFADKGNAIYSTRHLRKVLVRLARETSVQEIEILAHSAGNPIVVNAMRELRILDREMTPEQLQEKYKIQRVVLAAPDMDLQTFINAVYDRFQDLAEGVAVYTSKKDRALNVTSYLFRALRLGRATENINDWEWDVLRQVDQIEMIDATNAMSESPEFFGHSYFHNNSWVSSDVISFFEGRSPPERHLIRAPGAVFWTFPDDYAERF